MTRSSSALAETGLLTGSLTDWWLTLALYSLSHPRVSSRPRSRCCWQQDIPSAGWSPLKVSNLFPTQTLSESLGPLVLSALARRPHPRSFMRSLARLGGERATGRPAVAALVGDGSRSPRRPPFVPMVGGRQRREAVEQSRRHEIRTNPLP